jgi:hypothetical protein
MRDYHLNPDWYRTQYNLASEHLNWAASGDATAQADHLATAWQCVQKLLTQIESTLDERQRGRRPDAELCDFITDEVRPNAKLLLTHIELAQREGVHGPERREGEEGGDSEVEPSAATAVAASASTVATVLETAPSTSELNYSIARLYAQAQARALARKYLGAAVDKTEPNEWQALAHRIVRDPVLGGIEPQSIGSLEGFSPKLATAREETGVEARVEAQGLD